MVGKRGPRVEGYQYLRSKITVLTTIVVRHNKQPINPPTPWLKSCTLKLSKPPPKIGTSSYFWPSWWR